MNYDILKKIDNNTFDNFESLINNIKNKDKNIDNMFRVTAEGILKHLNEIECFVEDTNGFYNRIINNNKFQSAMLNKYKCDRKIMACLNEIKNSGNSSIHNNVDKFFDSKKSREHFARLLFLCQNILRVMYKVDMQLTIEKINDEYNILEKNSNKDVNNTKNNVISNGEEIITLDLRLKSKYLEDKMSLCTEENINIFKSIVKILISIVINDSTKYNDIEDLKIGEYSNLYKIYHKIDLIIDYDDENDIFTSLKDYSYTIRDILEYQYKIEVFNWLLDEDLEIEKTSNDNMKKLIAQQIEDVYMNPIANDEDDGVVYYIDKQKVFFVNECQYYELEIRKAIDYGNKNGKILVYSKDKIFDDYAMKINFVERNINYLDQDIKIYIITTAKVAIRPCELKNIVYLVTKEKIDFTRGKFYTTLVNYLDNNKCNLLDVITSNENIFTEFYNKFNQIISREKDAFFGMISKSRNIIVNEKKGHNILKYLLGTLKNRTIKSQTNDKYCINDETYITCSSKLFDNNPFSFNPSKNNPATNDLIKCIGISGYKSSLTVGKMQEYMKENQTIFVPVEEMKIKNVNLFIEEYNNSLLIEENGMCRGKINHYQNKYLYIEDDFYRLKNIISFIEKNTSYSTSGYYSVRKKEMLGQMNIDSEEKLDIINKAFDNSKLLLIYGEAGSGKTELICNYMTKIFEEKNILFIAKTHSALNNMKRRVNEKIGVNKSNFTFMSINKFNAAIKKGNIFKTDLIIIDECKIISNREVEDFFYKVNFDYCILSGDISQIDAIDLGNWFEVAKSFSNGSDCQLRDNYRTDMKLLKTVWDKVRNCNEDAIQFLENNNMVEEINSNIFNPVDNEEIILCLNYGGIYGINSINTYYQNSGLKKIYESFSINLDNVDKYKKGDPIVFNNDATNLYDGILYNNLKGEIQNIVDCGEYLDFYIKVFDNLEISDIKNVKLLEKNNSEKWSRIKLTIYKYRQNDDDRKDEIYTVPFDVAYARSIHKSQGLEYNSVKIIITPESEEKINNEIFYTAVTRAKKNLKIYCTKVNQLKEMKILIQKPNRQDAHLIEEIE